MLRETVRRAGQPRRRRARRDADRRARCSRTRSSASPAATSTCSPGVSGQELIDLSHWLGALITSAEIIGTRGITPVRALINEAASLVPERAPRALRGHAVRAAAACTPPRSATREAAWAAAADVSARDARPLPRRAGAPGAVARSRASTRTCGPAPRASTRSSRSSPTAGQVVLYAPHIREVSVMHPHIVEIGYHCRDYFVKQWDRFKDVHWGDLAHSTHLRGAGTYDEVDGERCRVTVTLATGIPEEQVRADQPRLPRSRRRSTPTPGRTTRTRSSCPRPARSSTACAERRSCGRRGLSRRRVRVTYAAWCPRLVS